MLSKDVRIVDLGADNWSRLIATALELLGGLKSAEPGPLLVVYRGLKLLGAVDLGRRRRVDVDFKGISRLDALCRDSGFARVVALQEKAISRIVGHAQREIHYADDYFKQWNAFLKGLSREWGRTVFTHPPGPRRLPVAPHWAVDHALRILVPDHSIMLLVITERGRVWASVALGYRSGDFWLLTSLDAFEPPETGTREIPLDRAAEMLASKYGGKVRAVIIERELLPRLASSRFPAGTALWAVNTGSLGLSNIPCRWRLAAVFASVFVFCRR